MIMQCIIITLFKSSRISTEINHIRQCTRDIKLQQMLMLVNSPLPLVLKECVRTNYYSQEQQAQSGPQHCVRHGVTVLTGPRDLGTPLYPASSSSTVLQCSSRSLPGSLLHFQAAFGLSGNASTILLGVLL